MGLANGRFRWTVRFRSELGNLNLLGYDASALTGTVPGIVVLEVADQQGDAAAQTGDNPVLYVEEENAGLPSYTGSFTPQVVGSYSLAVRQLETGGLSADYFDNQWLSPPRLADAHRPHGGLRLGQRAPHAARARLRQRAVGG